MGLLEVSVALEAKPVSAEILTPQQFVSLNASEKSQIKSATVVAPRLGSKGFGGVLVQYKLPQYRVR